MAYLLQAEKAFATRKSAVAALAASSRSLMVLDPSFDSSEAGKWTTDELARIRGARANRKVLAYLSIGEAEIYRSYWQTSWGGERGELTPAAPAFLSLENPDWSGNFKVRYWDRAWQNIIIGMLDEILEQGFDGVYLDIVDAFEFFEYDQATGETHDGKTNVATAQSYREDMIDWVARLKRHALRQREDFLVIPQNGSQLLAFPEYLAMVDGIAVESLYTLGEGKQPLDHTEYIQSMLKHASAAGKPVFVVEYTTSATAREYAASRSARWGYSTLFTTPELTALGTPCS